MDNQMDNQMDYLLLLLLLVIDARETENTIGNRFRPRDLGINMATKFHPGVSL